MNKKYSIGLLQFDIKWEDISFNLEYLSRFLEKLTHYPHFIVLPEMFTTGFTMHPENLDKLLLKKQMVILQDLSNRFNIGLAGSIVVNDQDSYYNRLLLFQPNDKLQSYNKRHLFRMGGEQNVYKKGSERNLFFFKGLCIFPQICYDLRFPVWSRNDKNYDILLNVANWPASRQDIWLTLLKARAIENQCYVIGINRTGSDSNGFNYCGGSVEYNARGEQLALLPDKESYIVVEIDLDELKKIREEFPAFKDSDEFEIQNQE